MSGASTASSGPAPGDLPLPGCPALPPPKAGLPVPSASAAATLSFRPLPPGTVSSARPESAAGAIPESLLVGSKGVFPKGPLDLEKSLRFTQGLGDVADACRLDLVAALRALPRSSTFPADQQAEMARHAVAHLSESIGGGRDLVFLLSPFKGRALGIAVDRASAPRYRNIVGEITQSEFVSAVLARLFPNAVVAGLDMRDTLQAIPSLAGRRFITLNVFDDAERNQLTPISHASILAAGLDTNTLQMSNIKGANTFSPTVSRWTVRAILGIPRAARVVHVYGDDKNAQGEEAGALLRRIDAEMHPDILIRSTTPKYLLGNRDPQTRLDDLARVFPDRPVVRLSQLTSGQLRTGRWVVVNDVLGVTQPLSMAADHQFVWSVVNPFEGLQNGTPTTVVVNRDLTTWYNLDTINESYVPYVVGTGGGNFVWLERKSETPPDGQRLTQGNSGVVKLRPYQVVGPDGQRPTTRFLNNLYFILRRELGK